MKNPLLYLRGILDHPADKLVRPIAEGGTTFEWGDDVEESLRDLEKLGGGKTFGDGSANRHPVAELRRAAWAVIFYTAEGALQAKVRGPVLVPSPPPPVRGVLGDGDDGTAHEGPLYLRGRLPGGGQCREQAARRPGP